jgi:hypothetical protein
MIKRRSKLHRGALMMLSAVPSIADFLSGLWTSRSRRRWLVPLVVFLSLTGLLLILAGSVEALAPFIYTIF